MPDCALLKNDAATKWRSRSGRWPDDRPQVCGLVAGIEAANGGLAGR